MTLRKYFKKEHTGGYRSTCHNAIVITNMDLPENTHRRDLRGQTIYHICTSCEAACDARKTDGIDS